MMEIAGREVCLSLLLAKSISMESNSEPSYAVESQVVSFVGKLLSSLLPLLFLRPSWRLKILLCLRIHNAIRCADGRSSALLVARTMELTCRSSSSFISSCGTSSSEVVAACVGSLSPTCQRSRRPQLRTSLRILAVFLHHHPHPSLRCLEFHLHFWCHRPCS